MFRPLYRYTHELVEALMHIEAARAAIDVLPLPRTSANELREQARRAQQDAAARLDGAGGRAYAATLSQIAGKSAAYPDEDALEALQTAIAGQPPNGYRRTSSLVYNQGHTDLIYVPPEAGEVPGLMDELLDWLDASWEGLPGIILAGICQQELLMIQPFEQANATLARAAGELILLRKGYGFGGYTSLTAALARRAGEYEEAARASHSGVYSRQTDFTNWLEFYCEALEAAAAEARLEVLNRFEAANRPELEGMPEAPLVLRDRQWQALRHMRDNGAIRSGEYQKMAGIVPDTARRDFDELMDKGLIAVRGVGRGTHYILTQRGMDEAEKRSAR